MADDLHRLPAGDLVRGYRRRRFSPVEVIGAVLDRIAAVNEPVNAFVRVDEEAALAAARDSEQRWADGAPCGLLDGVPATIKDILLSRGWPTLRGSRTVDPDQPWRADAPVTASLRRHGAVLLGKTTTPEFGWKGVTDSALSGITRNPWDTGRTPGGSSGGAAVACALGMGALHAGTDGGGSIRIPAGFTGVFGHKPSFGRVPAWPMSPFGTVAHVGPLTRTVEDAALMLTVISEPDARDWYALPYEPRDYRVGLESGVAGLRCAFSPDPGTGRVDAEVAAAVQGAAGTLADLGAEVEEITAPLRDAGDVFRVFWFAGAANFLRGFSDQQRARIDPGLQAVAEKGAAYTIADYYDATEARAELGRAMNALHEDFDLLLTPTLPIPAFAAGQVSPDPGEIEGWVDWTPFSYPFNLTQQPACSVPCGFTRAGLPVGMQVVGPMHADALVLRVARAYEAACPFRMPEAPRSAGS